MAEANVHCLYEDEEGRVQEVFVERIGSDLENLDALRESVLSRLDEKGIRQKEFLVTDLNRRDLLDGDLATALRRGQLILFTQSRDLPIPEGSAISTPLRFVPNHKSLTKRGQETYTTEDGKSSLVSAAGELIDNAADASLWNPAEGLRKWVKIVFCETPRRKLALAVFDKGKGFEIDDFEAFATMNLSQEDRGNSQKPADEDSESLYTSDNQISFHGVGAKTALFFAGPEFHIISRAAGCTGEEVTHFSMSEVEFERRQRENAPVYEGNASNISSLWEILETIIPQAKTNLPNIDEAVAEVASLRHFTIIVVPELYAAHSREIIGDRGYEFSRQLAAMFYWKMHGVGRLQPALKTTSSVKRELNESKKLELQTTSFPGEVTWRLNELNADVISQTLDRASHLFEVTVKPLGKSKAYLLHFYHNMKDGRESLPRRYNPPVSTSGYFPPALSVRLVGSPITGMLFINDSYSIDQSKQHVSEDLKALFLGLPHDETIFEPRGASEAFNKWVRACSKFDEILTFEDPDRVHDTDAPRTRFKRVSVAGKEKRIFEVGDKVTFRRRGFKFYGRIESLTCPWKTKEDKTVGSTGTASVRQAPEELKNSAEVQIDIYDLGSVLNDCEWRGVLTELHDRLCVETFELLWLTADNAPMDVMGPRVFSAPISNKTERFRLRAINKQGEELQTHQDGKCSLRTKVVLTNLARPDSCPVTQFLCNIGHVLNLPAIQKAGSYLVTASLMEYGLSPQQPLEETFQVKAGLPVAFSARPPQIVLVGHTFCLRLVLQDASKNDFSDEDGLRDLLPTFRPELQAVQEGFAFHVDQMSVLIEDGSVCLRGVVVTVSLTSVPSLLELVVALPGYKQLDTSPARLSVQAGPDQTLSFLELPEAMENGSLFSLTVEPRDAYGNQTTFIRGGSAQLVAQFSPGLVTGTISHEVSSKTGRVEYYGLVALVKDRSAWENSLSGIVVDVTVGLCDFNKSGTALEARARSRILPRRAPAALGFLPEGQLYGSTDGGPIELELPAGRSIENWQLLAWDEAGRQVEELASEPQPFNCSWNQTCDLRTGKLPPYRMPTSASKPPEQLLLTCNNSSLCCRTALKAQPLEPSAWVCEENGTDGAAGQLIVPCGQSLGHRLRIFLGDVYGNACQPPVEVAMPRISLRDERVSGDVTRQGWTPQRDGAVWYLPAARLLGKHGSVLQLRVDDEKDSYKSALLEIRLVRGLPHHVGISLDPSPGPTQMEVHFPVKDRYRFSVIRASINDEADNKLQVKGRVLISTDDADTDVSVPAARNSPDRPCSLVGFNADAVFEDVLFECTGMRGSELERRVLKFDSDGVESGRLVLSVSPTDTVASLHAWLDFDSVENSPQQESDLDAKSVASGSRLSCIRLRLLNSAGKDTDLSGVLPERSLEFTLLSPSRQVLLPNPSNELKSRVLQSGEFVFEPSKPDKLTLTEAGSHSLTAVYTERRSDLLPNLQECDRTVVKKLFLEVIPGNPHQLQIAEKPEGPLLVHVGKEDEGELVECLPCLSVRVEDCFGNLVPAGLWNEQISAEVISKDPSVGAPMLDDSGCTVSCGADGCAHFRTLSFSLEGCTRDGTAACKLRFKSGQLVPAETVLLVTNDSALRRKIAECTEKRAKTSRMASELEESLLQAEADLRNCLNKKRDSERAAEDIKSRLPAADTEALARGQRADELIRNHQRARDALPQERKARAGCTVESKVSGLLGFYGLLCDLAEIEDDSRARVISWYFGQSRLEMVVCRSDAIMALADVDDGFRVLDSSMVKSFVPAGAGKLQLTVPHGNQSLPEVLQGVQPELAVNVLRLREEHEAFRASVFWALLGNTLLLPKKVDAIAYRRFLVRDMMKECPTILTYEDGCHVAASGETGGRCFRAPATIQNLPAFFGSGPRPAAAREHQIIDTLRALRRVEKELEKLYHMELQAAAERDAGTRLLGPRLEKEKEEIQRLDDKLKRLEGQLFKTGPITAPLPQQIKEEPADDSEAFDREEATPSRGERRAREDGAAEGDAPVTKKRRSERPGTKK
ncbi:hypothetical protein KFL_000430380 [Klebsormidium nitens]|uniref:Uncharacterized protein n=1 Tax=Klebsormidium nitens TaxID=105231 RepID=A0A1Y1HTZ4_KLENI|nr:hypothetical protein KFL_000430380 [Klebsormidium nitens]|eukprot:GAQ79996.1 hypothetical protein KFL_000430380 [Klebsormidium nitens]